jgi:hypothetical protein
LFKNDIDPVEIFADGKMLEERIEVIKQTSDIAGENRARCLLVDSAELHLDPDLP